MTAFGTSRGTPSSCLTARAARSRPQIFPWAHQSPSMVSPIRSRKRRRSKMSRSTCNEGNQPMPRPLQLGNPDSGATFAVDDVRALAFGDPAERAAGRAINLHVLYSSHTSADLFTEDAFKDAFAKRRSLWDFRAFLPIADEEPVTLGEGNTPLLPIPTSQGTLYLKNESVNPTWSHKDRAMTVAVTVARSLGFHTVVGASTGNAGAALAAYAARAGMRCIMFTG